MYGRRPFTSAEYEQIRRLLENYSRFAAQDQSRTEYPGPKMGGGKDFEYANPYNSLPKPPRKDATGWIIDTVPDQDGVYQPFFPPAPVLLPKQHNLAKSFLTGIGFGIYTICAPQKGMRHLRESLNQSTLESALDATGQVGTLAGLGTLAYHAFEMLK